MQALSAPCSIRSRSSEAELAYGRLSRAMSSLRMPTPATL